MTDDDIWCKIAKDINKEEIVGCKECKGAGYLDEGECYICEGTGKNCFRPFPPGTNTLHRVSSKWAEKTVHEWNEFLREDLLKLSKLVKDHLIHIL
jgi:hypothetical protein